MEFFKRARTAVAAFKPSSTTVGGRYETLTYRATDASSIADLKIHRIIPAYIKSRNW